MQMEQETKERCDRMVAEAEMKAQQCWENCSVKIKELVDSFEGLQQIIEIYSSFNRKPEQPGGQIYGRTF
jgi:dsDNA-specific endonuclease/ATPase MutS2